jgi:transcriptional regulator with XRE-family HTH domain
MADDGMYNGTVARRQLAREITELRKKSGYSQQEAADELGVSLSTVSRLEGLKRTASVAEVRTMCTIYGKPDLADAFAVLAKASKQKSWYRQYSDVIPDWFDTYIGLEQAASVIRWYESLVIPGILQTEAYAHAVIRDAFPDDDEENDKRVQLRLERQALLTREINPQRWHIILDDALLRRPIGGHAVMRPQLEYLLEVAQLPNVTFGIVPPEFGMHPGVNTGPFVLMDFLNNSHNGQASEPATVYVEGFTGALYTVERNEVDQYTAAFEKIRRAALDPGRTQTVITHAMNELEKK